MEIPVIESPGGYFFREMRKSDLPGILETHLDSETRLYTRLLRQSSREDIESWLEYYPHYQRYGFGIWAIIQAETENFAGLCGLRVRKDLNYAVDISYRIHPQWRRMGIASGAVKACINFGFSSLKLKTILAQVHTNNLYSKKIMLKTGFTEKYTDGEWVNFSIGT